MPKRVGDWVARAFTSDASGLLVLSGTSLVRAYSYMPGQINESRNPAHWLEGLISPTSWAWVWLALGIIGLLAIWNERLLPLAVGSIVGLHAAWALSFITIQIVGGSSRAYVSALGYFAVAWLVVWGFGRGRNLDIARQGDG